MTKNASVYYLGIITRYSPFELYKEIKFKLSLKIQSKKGEDALAP